MTWSKTNVHSCVYEVGREINRSHITTKQNKARKQCILLNIIPDITQYHLNEEGNKMRHCTAFLVDCCSLRICISCFVRISATYWFKFNLFLNLAYKHTHTQYIYITYILYTCMCRNIAVSANKIRSCKWMLDDIPIHVLPGSYMTSAWWRHQLKTFSASLAICAGNSPVSLLPLNMCTTFPSYTKYKKINSK